MATHRIVLHGRDNGPGDYLEVYVEVDTNTGDVLRVGQENDTEEEPQFVLRRAPDVPGGAQRIYQGRFSRRPAPGVRRREFIPIPGSAAERIRLTYDPIRDRWDGLDGEVT